MAAVVVQLTERFYESAFDVVDGKAREALGKLYASCYFVGRNQKIHEAIHDFLYKTGGAHISRCVGTRYLKHCGNGVIEVIFNLNIVLCTNLGTTHYLHLKARCAYFDEVSPSVFKQLKKQLQTREQISTEHGAESLLEPVVSLQ